MPLFPNSLTPCTLKHPMFIGWPGPTAAPCKTAPARPQNGPYGHPKRPFSQADGATPGKGLHHRQICKQAPPDSRLPRNTSGGTAECNRLHRFYTLGYCMAGMIVVSLQKTRRQQAMCDQCCIAPVCNALAEDKAATGTGATRLATARAPSTRKESQPRQTGKPRPRPKGGPLQLKQTA